MYSLFDILYDPIASCGSQRSELIAARIMSEQIIPDRSNHFAKLRSA
jgi:hypothetical protein